MDEQEQAAQTERIAAREGLRRALVQLAKAKRAARHQTGSRASTERGSATEVSEHLGRGTPTGHATSSGQF